MADVRKGDKVRQKMPAPIEGVVSSFSICQETGKVQVLVTTTNAEGDEEGRYFAASDLEVIPQEPPAS